MFERFTEEARFAVVPAPGYSVGGNQFCPQSKSEPIVLAEARRLGSQVRYGAGCG